jgi:hypothetical protein
VLHASPGALFATQMPPEAQKEPPAQSASEAQDEAHALPLQLYGPQLFTGPDTHVPAPSQMLGSVSVPPVQLAAPQTVPAGATRQAPAALQSVPPHGPPEPQTDWQQWVPPQTFDVHWLLELHAPPGALFTTQVPLAVQKEPPPQSASDAQDEAHAVPLHL